MEQSGTARKISWCVRSRAIRSSHSHECPAAQRPAVPRAAAVGVTVINFCSTIKIS